MPEVEDVPRFRAGGAQDRLRLHLDHAGRS